MRRDSLWLIESPTGGTATVWTGGNSRLGDEQIVSIFPGDRISRVTGRKYWAAVMTRPRISLATVLWIVSVTWLVGRLGKAAGWW